MAKVTPLKALANFFNSGTGFSVESDGGPNVPATVAGIPEKRNLKDFQQELKALSDEEKLGLAQEVVKVTGDELIMPATK